MGRKIKSILLLIVILALIYRQHSTVSYAEDIMNGPGSEVQKESSGSEEQENGGQETEKLQKYSLEYPEADGRNGYYITAPAVKLTHNSKRGSTVYCLKNNGVVRAEGELKEEESSVVLQEEKFEEGSNVLAVYMKDEAGEKVEEYEETVEIRLDTQKPVFEMKASEGFEAWYQKEAWIYVTADDGEKGSSIESVSCYGGNQMAGTVKGSTGEFLITHASENGKGVNITVTVVDKAGHRSEKTRKMYIDNSAPKVAMDGITDYMITSQPVSVIYKIKEDNGLKVCKAQAEWEDPDGRKQVLPAEEWTDETGVRETALTLSEDGIYFLSLSAEDLAGYTDKKEAQIIIDSRNPVIRYVDRLEGAYMKSFRWNYERDAFIQDFTSYTYQIQLDGQPYPIGEEVTAEGRHTLKVNVVDSAGNKAEAAATFVVDHTPPEIIFSDVEENGEYEEEKSFKVTLKNPTDEIQEIRINGTPQTLSREGKAYHYTVQEHKSYEVEAKACDKAGNQAISRVAFEVIPKETVVQKAVKPFQKIFMGEAPVHKKGEKEEQESGRKWIIVVCGTVFLICGAYVLRKKIR